MKTNFYSRSFDLTGNQIRVYLFSSKRSIKEHKLTITIAVLFRFKKIFDLIIFRPVGYRQKQRK